MKQIIVNSIPIELEKKRIKNMYLRILPPDGRVHVTAPLRINEEDINRFVTSKHEWIIKQQEKLQKNTPPKEMKYETGEKISFWGKTYYLVVKESKYHNKPVIEENDIILYVRAKNSQKQRAMILDAWYRESLQREIPCLISKWENIIGVKSSSWNIRNMKSRWGTCNIQSRNICLNLQLAKKPPQCLEYVVVHELTHLLEKSHNYIFKGYLDHFLPQWRSIKKELNKTEEEGLS